ncbi:PREDICTED: uncharacterized protein LOC107347168 isoform X1 [Acropora digitifera]|uniref:uncharacterized protein LOC107347168 isoform X1 n=1 Tax=Acropora digitifera TaxID=70779 RepID=UPI00077B12DF|nr:PREDICTED: uncharacterized protein LOC107347168 isoform X1 [Acropora digitifera]
MAIIGIGFLSASFFSAAVLLLVTLLSIERWMHMRRRLLMTHFRRNVIVAVIVIFPVSVTVSNAVQFRVLETTNKVSFAFIGVFMLLCYLITFFAYFKVYRIIRQHQQQIHETQSQSFEQSTINLAKYKRAPKKYSGQNIAIKRKLQQKIHPNSRGFSFQVIGFNYFLSTRKLHVLTWLF